MSLRAYHAALLDSRGYDSQPYCSLTHCYAPSRAAAARGAGAGAAALSMDAISCVTRGDVEGVRALLRGGMNPNVQGCHGGTVRVGLGGVGV